MDFIEKIRERSRDEWSDYLKGNVNTIRIWIEDNGIKASGVALVAGMLFILFFKLFLFVIVVSGLVGFFIWSVSIPQKEISQSSESKSSVDSSESEDQKNSNSDA